MIYSVWNQGAWKYDYYESGQVQDRANAPMPAHLLAEAKQSPLGLAPEQVGWPLPPDAVPRGQGEYPRGRIATRRRIGRPVPVGDVQIGGLGFPWPIALGLGVLIIWAVAPPAGAR